MSVDGVWQSSPHQTLWSIGSHQVEAHATIGANWDFDHWSDGGDRSHSANVSLDQFGTAYTAEYVVARRFVIPTNTQLESYPNPFNPTSTIRYGLPTRSRVFLAVYNTLGQQIAVLVNKEQEAGYHDAKFNASALPSGVYYYRLQRGGVVRTGKALLAR